MASLMSRVGWAMGTGIGIGLAPFAPATWASLVAVLIYGFSPLDQDSIGFFSALRGRVLGWHLGLPDADSRDRSRSQEGRLGRVCRDVGHLLVLAKNIRLAGFGFCGVPGFGHLEAVANQKV